MDTNKMDRRDFMLAAGAGALGAIAATAVTVQVAEAQSPSQPAPVSPQAIIPRIDRVRKNGVLRVGCDLSLPPNQFRDPKTNNPTGLLPELVTQMAKDLNVKLEFVEMPWSELLPGFLADKFDWTASVATITPARSLQVLFLDAPIFFEDSILILKKGLTINSTSELDNPNVTISCMSGSAQDATARLMFPKANNKPLGFPESLLEVAAGRSHASLVHLWGAAQFINQNSDAVDFWKGGPLYQDMNTWYVPLGDYKTKEWMSNWVRYFNAHRWIENRFVYWNTQRPGYAQLRKKLGLD